MQLPAKRVRREANKMDEQVGNALPNLQAAIIVQPSKSKNLTDIDSEIDAYGKVYVKRTLTERNIDESETNTEPYSIPDLQLVQKCDQTSQPQAVVHDAVSRQDRPTHDEFSTRASHNK